MGNVSSRADDGGSLYLKDQYRLAVTSVKVTNSRGRNICTLLPTAFPATKYIVRKEPEDESIVEYVQDPESSNLLLRLYNDEDILFYFTFAMRQTQPPPTQFNGTDKPPAPTLGGTDVNINRLTFVFASTLKDLDTLVTREFNADPNLHKNPNVDLLGDYSTAGSPLETFEWSWRWRPPKSDKDKGGGWRNACSFVEYDQRAHRLNTLVTFSFWVQHAIKPPLASPILQRSELMIPVTRNRLPSGQSVDSKMSDSENELKDMPEPGPAPFDVIPEDGLGIEPTMTNSGAAIDFSCQRPGSDISAVDDGPVFRATIKALEQKNSIIRARMKKVLKKAEAAKDTQVACNVSIAAFMEALREASSSNANAVQPALDNYFERIATEILTYEKNNADNLQRLIIDPLSKFYSNDIKQAEAKKKDFENESQNYYAYVSRYLGQREGSLKEKKRAESDAKYQSKRRNFELRRFDYSSFMQDLHGGRKDQEVLSQLTKFADAQARSYLATAKRIETMLPQLESLSYEVREADKEYQLQRTGREEKRRALEKTSKIASESETIQTTPTIVSEAPSSSNLNLNRMSGLSDSDYAQATQLKHSGSVTERPRSSMGLPSNSPSTSDPLLSTSPRNPPTVFGTSPSQKSKFQGIRDLEEREYPPAESSKDQSQHRKEGLLWSLSRPGSHVDPRGLNKQAWHKYWIVLDQGKLSEYINWKHGLEPHLEPIDLRVASVREARNQDRRFCFEVITPNYTRIYQAQSGEEMKTWIHAINNALQSAFESKLPAPEVAGSNKTGSIGRDIFGKSSSFHGHRSSSSSNIHTAQKSVSRYASVGEHTARPYNALQRSYSTEERNNKLLEQLREADAGNLWCADCDSDSRVEWVSINLGIVVCIECSGIHRSLGTHITKIRSLTLDTVSFTQDLVELLLQIGNRVSNMIWEATLDRAASPPIKPSPTSSREHRLRFITNKYADRAFVSPLPATTARPDDTLLTSIKRNDIQHVLHALALKANPNAQDRSRSTHSVFLALAAADPAGGPAAKSGDSADEPRKSFAIAELLVQNGADIPEAPPPIPLSKSAQAYVDFQRERKLGRARAVPSKPVGVTPGVQPVAANRLSGTAAAANGPVAVPVSNGAAIVGVPAPASAPSAVLAGPGPTAGAATSAGMPTIAAGEDEDDQLTALPKLESVSSNLSLGGSSTGSGVGGAMGALLERSPAKLIKRNTSSGGSPRLSR